jgi:hypothetical protein
MDVGALAAAQLLAGSMDQHKTGALERNAGNRHDEGKYAEQAVRYGSPEAVRLTGMTKLNNPDLKGRSG